MTFYRRSRKTKRLRTIERLCVRSLLASDLGVAIDPLSDFESFASSNAFEVAGNGSSEVYVDGHTDIPKEPDELVQRDREYYASLPAGRDPSLIVPLSDTFKLHSRPTATKTVFLDFDGNTTIGTSWNRSYNVTNIVSPAYDPDRNGAAFTNNELTRIQGIWQRVATDFAAFDINVTTEDPGVDALVNTGGSDTRWGIQAVMTVDNFANSGAGGFAYINSFNWNFEAAGATETPCFIFNTTEVSVAAAISHEVGHSLGLAHDGTTGSHPTQPNQGYYNGHGTGENSWGPIMGVGGYYSNVTTWDAGEYFAANNVGSTANFGRGPDDISIITTFNGFGVIPDDHGGATSSASSISYLGSNIANPSLVDVSLFGTIGTRTDLDFIGFQTGSGVVDLTIDPYVSELWRSNSSGTYDRSIEKTYYGTAWSDNQGTNLDVEAKLYDSSGNLVATSSPVGLRASFANLSLTAGTYFISVDGVGFADPSLNPPVGYTDYGSIGQYLVTGTVVALGVDVDLGPGTALYAENSAPVPVSPAATFLNVGGVNFDLLTVTASVVNNAEPTDQLSIISTGQIAVNNNQVSYGGVVFGTLTQSPNLLSVDLASNATQAGVEALVRSIGYSSMSDGPSTLPRRVEVSFGLGVSDTRDVVVVSANDSPSVGDSSLPTIDEDALVPFGDTIDLLVGNSFVDPDPGAKLAGIAIVGNAAVSSTEGIWYYSSNQGVSWSAIGDVNDSTGSLVISSSDRLGFLPAPNYFGSPSPLRVRALDDTYTSTFSNSTGNLRKYLDSSVRAMQDGPLSATTGNVIVGVRNINDAPFANAPVVQIQATQDQPVNFKFDNVHANGLFSDIDSTNLSWTLIPISIPQTPAWIKFDPVAHTLRGMPENSDVGTIEFQLRAADSFGLSVTIPLTVTVANINDPPQILDLAGRDVTENDLAAKIGQINGYDPDLKDAMSYSVSDSRFVVNGGTLFLQSSAFLDFETEPQVEVVITATDNGTPTLSTSRAFTISVRDVNEYFPTLATQDFLIPSNRTNNHLLGIVQATDQDSQQAVKYKVHQDVAGIFEVDTNSGEVRLKPGAQVTEKNYLLFIAAFDNGVPSNSRIVQFNVKAEIPNLFTPVVTSGRNLSVPENSAPGTTVGKIVAQDADGDLNLSYSLASSPFKIDSSTGTISVAEGAKLNFETQPTYVVTVNVTDSGSPARTGIQAVTISLQNVNDPPSAIRLSDSKVPTLQKGFELSQMLVTDEDPSLQYIFTTSDPRFEIRNSKLALRQSAFFDTVLAGTTSKVDITVTDTNDPTSSATLPLAFDIFGNPFPWQNRVSSFDVNADGVVSALDALLVINALNSQELGRGPLAVPRGYDQLSLFYVDTSGDNVLSPIDALLVVNELLADRGSGEGESLTMSVKPGSLAATSPTPIAPETWFDAYSSLEKDRRRRS